MKSMKPEKALQIIFILSIAGLLFSGYLSYQELFKEGCSVSPFPISCGSTTIADLPACVYGFLMYMVIFAASGLGLKSFKK